MCQKVTPSKGLPKSIHQLKLKPGQHVLQNPFGVEYMIDENNTAGYWQWNENTPWNLDKTWLHGTDYYVAVHKWCRDAAKNKGTRKLIASGGSVKMEVEEVKPATGYTLTPEYALKPTPDTPTVGGMTMKDFKRHAYVIRMAKPTIAMSQLGHYPAYDQGQLIEWQRMVHFTANLLSKLSARNAKGKLSFDMELFLDMCGARECEGTPFKEIK